MENWIQLHHVVARLFTPKELNIELSCVVMILILKAVLKETFFLFYIRSCLIVYGFFTFVAESPEGFRSGTQKIVTLMNLEFSLRILLILFDCAWESRYGREEESKESDKVSQQPLKFCAQNNCQS